MLNAEINKVYEFIDKPSASGEEMAETVKNISEKPDLEVKKVEGEKGFTDFIKFSFPGSEGKIAGGDAPTLGIVGRLGGVGARPEKTGTVSDADGAIVASALSLKLASMLRNGDELRGDVLVTTHICPHAPTKPHDPVPFMDSPVDMEEMNEREVDPQMDALLSIDTTKGNRVINHNGFAISPTVREGYILEVNEDLLDIMEIVTGRKPVTFPLSIPDITPYGNDLHHINSILQPACATNSPVVGVATTSGSTVPGVATGANYPGGLEETARFCLEVAKAYTEGKFAFIDEGYFNRIKELYGSMERFQQLSGKGGS